MIRHSSDAHVTGYCEAPLEYARALRSVFDDQRRNTGNQLWPEYTSVSQRVLPVILTICLLRG
jgi:hypothetical protein